MFLKTWKLAHVVEHSNLIGRSGLYDTALFDLGQLVCPHSTWLVALMNNFVNRTSQNLPAAPLTYCIRVICVHTAVSDISAWLCNYNYAVACCLLPAWDVEHHSESVLICSKSILELQFHSRGMTIQTWLPKLVSLHVAGCSSPACEHNHIWTPTPTYTHYYRSNTVSRASNNISSHYYD